MAKFGISRLLIVTSCLIGIQPAFAAASFPAEAAKRLQAGQALDLIVEYDSAAIEQEADRRRKLTPRRADDKAILDYKAVQYRSLKQRIDGGISSPEITHVYDYSHLPMSLKHVQSMAALDALAAQPGIKAVYENGQLHHVLAQSLPLVNQPAVAAAGERGNGTTVAVIDDGIDYTNAAFGSCTAPGVPAGCHVNVSLQFGTGSASNTHGTNVSAIVLGMAPDSRVAMLNAFSGATANFADILAAFNWAIANKVTYNIASINMSLGDGTLNTSPCSSGNPFTTPVTNANNAGISVVAAAGNDAFTNGLGLPACTPGVISVGAVYDSDLGNQGYPSGVNWGNCTDTATAADKVACFSDSASFLTMLAPGALITAAGITMGGTSQASPHVAGAIAVLHSTFPAETQSQIQARVVNSGIQVTDTRNSLNKPRLNLLEAARPANDAFVNRELLSGAAGSASGTNLLATKQTGEPNHAANSGGASVWWKWTAPSAGQASLNTHGSGFDTLLAVYTGTGVGALVPIAANDNDGTAGNTSGLLFETQAGKEYEIAVDGFNAAAGNVILNWSLNTTASSKLTLSLSGPASAASGNIVTYTLAVTNAGPQIATNVVTKLTLPAGVNYVSGPAGCSASANIVTCLSGNIANGGNVVLPILLDFGNGTPVEILAASVTSDLPNPAPSGSNTSMQVTVSNSNDNDVPDLPWWGQLLLATLLGGIALNAGKRI